MNSTAPLISIVTASYNALDGLKRTVESVREQGFASLEHIVVDGGSNDGTREFLSEQGDNVRWISEPDRGIADALNKGVSKAQGQYILVLQAGDSFLARNSAQIAAKHLNGSDMVGFAVNFQKLDGECEKLPSRPLSIFTEFRLLNPHQGLFCHRRVFEKIGLFDEDIRIVMDYDHMLKAKHSGFELDVVDTVIAVMPADGVSSRDDWQGRHALLSDQARVQWRNAYNPLHKAALAVFWTVWYPAFYLKWRFFRMYRFY